MTDSSLPKQIEALVDNLRKQDSVALSLTEVASVTEVLIGTMQSFFKSIDTSIYDEFRSLTDYIENARKEIASLQPVNLESQHIPRAELELDAIVQQTEEATNTIMEAAEEIMGADTDNHEAYQATTQDAVMRIFEACSFQDITGQRISKVVETLSHIEKRVLELRDLLGITDDEIEDAQGDVEIDPEKALLSGPALDGEGIDQNEVDALMGGGASEDAAPVEKVEAKPEPAPKAEKPPKPEPPKQPEPPKPVSPKVLDSMFEEDFDPVAELAEKEAEKAAAKAEEKAPDAPASEPAETAKEAPKEDKPKEDKKAKKAPESAADDDLPAGEEVSQDDIDALFG